MAARVGLRRSPVRRARRAIPDPPGDFLDGYWSADVIALGGRAAESLQDLQAGLVLDAFRNHLEAETARQLDGRPHDGGAAFVLGQSSNEGTIDLDLLDRQALQVCQGGVASAKVIDREPNAAGPKAVHRFEHSSGLRHD